MGRLGAGWERPASDPGSRLEVLRVGLDAGRCLGVRPLQPPGPEDGESLSGECGNREDGLLENVWSGHASWRNGGGRSALLERWKRLCLCVLAGIVGGVCGARAEIKATPP